LQLHRCRVGCLLSGSIIGKRIAKHIVRTQSPFFQSLEHLGTAGSQLSLSFAVRAPVPLETCRPLAQSRNGLCRLCGTNAARNNLDFLPAFWTPHIGDALLPRIQFLSLVGAGVFSPIQGTVYRQAADAVQFGRLGFVTGLGKGLADGRDLLGRKPLQSAIFRRIAALALATRNDIRA